MYDYVRSFLLSALPWVNNKQQNDISTHHLTNSQQTELNLLELRCTDIFASVKVSYVRGTSSATLRTCADLILRAFQSEHLWLYKWLTPPTTDVISVLKVAHITTTLATTACWGRTVQCDRRVSVSFESCFDCLDVVWTVVDATRSVRSLNYARQASQDSRHGVPRCR